MTRSRLAIPCSLVLLAALVGCAESEPPAAMPSVTAAEPPAGPAWFEVVPDAGGLEFRHVSGDPETYYFPETVCGGVALFDMDADGDLDAYLVQSGRLIDAPEDRPGNRLFRNRGDGSFEDVTEGSGAEDRGYGMGVASGDYDADGDSDLYVTNVGGNALLRNDGDGRFADVSDAAGVAHDGWGSSAAFVDYDADGDLDLFVVNYIHWSARSERECYGISGLPDYCSPSHYQAPAMDVLYRNEGDGTFTDVTTAAGLDQAFGNGLGIGCADFSGDGLVDIFIANDGMQNQLWINRGDGTFADEAMTRGCAIDHNGAAKAGMGVAVADVDDDADPDLLVVNIQTETDSFFRNAGDYFLDDTATVGLGRVSRGFTRFGTAFADFDQDGHLDLYEANGGVRRLAGHGAVDPFAETNVLFRGTSDGRFEEVLPRGGTAAAVIRTSRGAAFGDIDGDGDVDALIANRDEAPTLLRNVVANGHWLRVRAVEPQGSDALGAVVSVRWGDRSVWRVVQSAYSYCAANDPRVHIGLGEVGRYDEIRVRWADGSETVVGPGDADREVLIRRGDTPGAS